ncbi:MAG: iron-sulfur cluster repair di-iron protein [Candidatus Krumholzibacteriia bacterium]|nr:iron-sulfur cluster repair di-iron protein [bacterium]MCB9513951.1 iron-sulfur cluster repair di-iron protein [Candidatus Latescibacterota bacterium]
MKTLDLQSTVGEWVAERPGRSRTLEQLGIDYCCGGKRSLDEACRTRGLDPEEVVSSLRESAVDSEEAGIDWRRQPLSALCDHIETTHHAFLREELPRLAALAHKVAGAHGARHPEYVTLDEQFGPFRGELEMHMVKEERILFPAIRDLEDGGGSSFHCGDLSGPIQVMEMEHDTAAGFLREFATLTQGYRPPADACGSLLALLDGLATLEADLHLHIHKENNILFPRTRARMSGGAANDDGRQDVR